MVNLALITCNHTSHQIQLILNSFWPLVTNLNTVHLSVLESGIEKPSKMWLYIFNFSHRIVWTNDFEISWASANCRTVMWQSSQTLATTIFTISFVQMLNSCPTWGSNVAVSLPLETLCQCKIFESPSCSSSVYTLCIDFAVSAADFVNRQQNFITLSSFFTFKQLLQKSW